jgi:hypothetical protein
MAFNRYCNVPKCSGYNGLQFPKDKELREKWCSTIKKAFNLTKYNPLINSYVCKTHFKETDFIIKKKNTTKKQLLKKGAIPSIFSCVEPTTNKKIESVVVDVSRLDVDFTIEVQILDGQGMILLFINLVHYLII